MTSRSTRNRPSDARTALCTAACVILLVGCQLPGVYEPLPPRPQPGPGAPEEPDGSGTPMPEQLPPQPVPPPPQPQPKQFRLGPASSALVAQAQSQSAAGNHALAVATLERALRIEPDNPLVWIELAKVHQAEGNHARADGMGRKALALARGDGRAQAAAWYVIAESLRARGRNAEAADAEQRAMRAERSG
ncbi:MAG: tetratricopeptide repeat protein [Steroidobacteraceae bacterium]